MTKTYEPPNSQDAEYDVLGCIFKRPKTIDFVASTLTSEDYFYWPKLAIIYKMMLDLAVSGEPVHINAVADLLLQDKKLEFAGGRLAMVNMVEGVINTTSLESSVKIVRDKAVLRQIIAKSQEVINTCYNQIEPVSETLSRYELAIAKISNSLSVNDDPVSISEIIPGVLDQIAKDQEPESKTRTIGTGLVGLDRITGGFGPSNLIALGGWTSQGKTQLALQIAIANALDGKAVGMFTLEMNRDELVKRMLLTESMIGADIIQNRGLTSDNWDTLRYQADKLSSADMLIYDRGDMNISRLKSLARMMLVRHGIRLLIVDYIQLLDAGRSNGENRQSEVAFLSRSLKNLAMELQIPVMVLAQLTDLSGHEKDRRPKVRDFRESKAIGHDANKVINVSHTDEHGSELVVAKNREGNVGSLSMNFINGRWSELSRMKQV